MNIHTFLALTPQKVCSQYKLIVFESASYSAAFFSLVRLWLMRHTSITLFDLQEHSMQELMQQCMPSIIQEPSGIWVHGQADNFVRKKEHFSWFNSYEGSQVLVLILTDAAAIKDRELVVKVTLPNQLYEKDFKALYDSFFGNVYTKQLLIAKLFALYVTLTLEQAAILMPYISLCKNSDAEIFATTIAARCIRMEQSLFACAEALFAKHKTVFFVRWYAIKDTYPLPFWLSYWSEQFFRAAWYVEALRSDDRAHAKKIGYKLPFSFLNRDWKLFEPRELAQAHQALYNLDYAFKHGGSERALELFYADFLHGAFRL